MIKFCGSYPVSAFVPPTNGHIVIVLPLLEHKTRLDRHTIFALLISPVLPIATIVFVLVVLVVLVLKRFCHLAALLDEEKVAAEVVLVEGGRVAVVFTTRVVNGVVGRPPDRL